MKKVLTIAGSDSSGCSGIQRDIRTITTLGAHPLCTISTLTTQTPSRVLDVSPAAEALVRSQLLAVLESGVDAVKIGVLPTWQIVSLVADLLSEVRVPIVLDPVIQSSSGHSFSDVRTQETLKSRLFPQATVVTPNFYEASQLSGIGPHETSFVERASRELLDAGPQAVLITGGHSPDPVRCTDFLFQESGLTEISGARVETAFTRGSGCALSSSLATFLAQGQSCLDACRNARSFIQTCFQSSYALDSQSGTLGSGDPKSVPR